MGFPIRAHFTIENLTVFQRTYERDTPLPQQQNQEQKNRYGDLSFSVKNISRAQGRSAVACAAYRSGEKLIDERQGKEQDYTKKNRVELTRIYAPIGTKAELLERGQLWNAVEKTERRKDANLAREFEIALPQELNKAEREKLVDELCNKIVERHNVIVDAAIHAPHTDSGSDERNYHAHIMFTGRQIDLETGDFAAKKNRDFNKENSSETVQKWREDFADMTNAHLMRAGHLFSSVDHRSYAAQGLNKEATAHEGSAVTKLRRLGIDTEISLSNDAIKQRNAERHNLPKLIDGLEQRDHCQRAHHCKTRAAASRATHSSSTTSRARPIRTKL